MRHILESPLFSVTITIFIYYITQRIYLKFKFFLFNPLFITITSLIFILKFLNIEYTTYFKGGRIIDFFLAPSVVALGLPLYREFEKVKKNLKAIMLSIITGSVTGIFSAGLTAKLLGASTPIVYSMIPKSVTTPIAMEISRKIGGIPSLTAAIVIAVGVFGAVVGPSWLRLIGIKSKLAFGLAMGAAAHGGGTAKAMEEGELQGAMSGLGLCLNGIVTAILTPFFMPFF